MNTKFKLVYLKNNTEFLLDSPSILVGRSDSCPIKLDVDNMSREHARLQVKDDAVFVQDLHSTNSTFVNGKRISEVTELTPGCTVQFGEESFTLQAIDHEVTIVGIPFSSKNKRSESSFIDDEDEEDSTVLFQAYQMPPGWNNMDDDATDFDSSDSELKKNAIEAYVKKTTLAFKNAKGIILFFFVEDEPPSIRMLSLTDSEINQWTFGRTESNDIIFRHQSISETHAILSRQNNRWTLSDADSTNGIWLNKNRCKSIEISDGIHFHTGTVEVLARLINH